MDDELTAEAQRLDEEGFAAFKAGDTERARDLHTASLAVAREANDSESVARGLAGLMRVALRTRDYDELAELVSQGENLARESGNESLERFPLHMKAEGLRMQGRLGEARQAYLASIALNRSTGNDTMVTVESLNLAWVEIDDGRIHEAAALATAHGSGHHDDAYLAAFALLTRARVAAEFDDPAAPSLLAEAEERLRSAELVWDPAEEPAYQSTRARIDEPHAGS